MLKSHLLVSNLIFKRGNPQKVINEVNTVLEDKVTLYYKLSVCLHIVRLSCRMPVID